MSIRFATPNPPRGCLTRWQSREAVRRAVLSAANDNLLWQARAAVLHDALSHFAVHGVGAARLAGERALAAAERGDAPDHARWLDICRSLDRRLAVLIERKVRLTTATAAKG